MTATSLTRAEAAQRAATVSVTAYRVVLDVTTGPVTFSSESTVRFSATPGAATFVDLIAASVERIVLNGTALDPGSHFDGARITLPELAADNELYVAATCRYMNSGEGLHRFVDPVDDEVYLYSQFQVADARRAFAVFDQPDLKASFEFHVTAPDHWVVLSNEPVSAEPQPRPGLGRRWSFLPTPRLSPYITAIVAGPYREVRDEVVTRGGRVPLGLYCRSSLFPFLDADEVLDVTKRGFAYFEQLFDMPYPFAKYDQVFCPEYNMGAMENAGCVTITETYLFRARPVQALVERRALTVLHELAHMWFGNLVTLRWWDDMWLNESFAEWAANAAQAEATRWTGAWTTFAVWEKAKGYTQDQLSSTHPVVADIASVESVQVNFDSITYSKGASVLKQLVAYVGREEFDTGVREYLRRHAWGNTTLPDLLASLEATSGRDLSTWSKLWLETAGVNTLTPVLTVGPDGLVTGAFMLQTATAEHPTLRPHRLAVGSYQQRDGRLVRTQRVELDVDGERTELPHLVGAPRPDLLLLNDDDLTFAHLVLDDHSLATALAHPRGFQDSLPRALVLAAAWQMTFDATLPARDFIQLVLASLDGERDSTQIRRLLLQLGDAARLYVAPQHRAQTLARVCAGLRELAKSAPPGSDAQLQLTLAFASYATMPSDLARVQAVLDSAGPAGLVLDTELRWQLLSALVAGGAAGPAEIEAELRRDATAAGREWAAHARAAIPTPAAKEAAWRLAVTEGGLPNQTVAAIGAGFTRVHDAQLLRPFVGAYHDALTGLWRTRTYAIVEDLIQDYYPARLADQSLLDATQAWLDAHQDEPAALRRLVSEHRDAMRRALAAQAFDAYR
ncbi:MAG TPA: aminopeptidase N [Dermatophilaceae bacterium]|nr:aminopeptidase N [Dermatophilaceae bacterium]